MRKQNVEGHSITLEPDVWMWIDEEIADGVGNSRSEVIRHHLIKARKLKQTAPRSIKLLLDFFDALEAQPELIPALREFLKDRERKPS